jgi:hypothetical protein
MEHFLRVSIFGLTSKLDRHRGEQDRVKVDKLHRSKQEWMSACDESMFRPAVLQAATSEQLSINKPIPHLPTFAILKTPARKKNSYSLSQIAQIARTLRYNDKRSTTQSNFAQYAAIIVGCCLEGR